MRLSHRNGFSLVELLISIAIAGIAAALMFSTLARQQRFYSSASAAMSERSQLQDAAAILSTEIRTAAVELGVPAMRDTAIEFFTMIGASVVCTVPAAQTFGLAPLRHAPGTSLTSMLALPEPGDLALIYTLSTPALDSGAWELRDIDSFTTRSVATACPPESGFTLTGDVGSGSSAYSVSLISPTDRAVRPGSSVRFVRRARYSIYRSSDNKWYLGYRRCSATGPSVCAGIQPVAGPYLPYSDGRPGLSFRYFDRLGQQLSDGDDGTRLARVDLVIHKASKGALLASHQHSLMGDSVVVSFATRNRFR